MSLPHTVKGIFIMIFLFTLITANAMNTPVTAFFQESQTNMINDVENVTMGQNLSISVPLVGSYELPNTTGIMSFFNWIKLIFDTLLTLLGLLGVFYSMVNMFPAGLGAPIMIIGVITIIFSIVAYISSLGRE